MHPLQAPPTMKAALSLLMLALLLHGCAAAVKTIKVTVPLSAPTSGVTGFTSVPINGKTVGMFTGTTSGAFMTTVGAACLWWEVAWLCVAQARCGCFC